MNNKLSTIIILLLLTLLISSGASAEFTRTSDIPAPVLAPITTAFTYQGSLTDGGSPANGAYDFEFKLFNDASIGTQVGSTVTKGDVVTSEGIFTVELGFGDVFDGTAYWLEIWVRPGASTGGYQQLLPRQPLTAVPYANYALDADLLDGMQGSGYRNASNLNAGVLNNGRFSAYSDLSAEGYLNNNGVNDLLIRSQSDARYWNASNINSGTLDDSRFSAYSDLSNEGHLGQSLYRIHNWCGGTSSSLTLDNTCDTQLCYASHPLYYYWDCSGFCLPTNTSPQTCNNINLGRLVD